MPDLRRKIPRDNPVSFQGINQPGPLSAAFLPALPPACRWFPALPRPRQAGAGGGEVSARRGLFRRQAIARERLRVERIARVEAALGDGRAICDRCGATLESYADICSANFDEACPGFVAIESAGKANEVAK